MSHDYPGPVYLDTIYNGIGGLLDQRVNLIAAPRLGDDVILENADDQMGLRLQTLWVPTVCSQ